MNPQAKLTLLITGAAALFGGIVTICKSLWEIVKIARSVRRYVIVHLGEHDLMAEDYCIRRSISRHNMQVMAMALASAEEQVQPNGKAHNA